MLRAPLGILEQVRTSERHRHALLCDVVGRFAKHSQRTPANWYKSTHNLRTMGEESWPCFHKTIRLESGGNL